MSTILSKYFVYIDSRNRISGTDSDFTYNIKFPPDQTFNRVVLLDALIPKSYYLVQEGYNTFILNEEKGSSTITVPPGCYLLTTFATVIQSLLNSNSPNGYTYSVTYPNIQTSANTGMFTYNVSGNGSDQPSITVSDTFFEPFGFDSGSTNNFNNNSLTSTNVIKLQVEDRLFIHSSCVANPNNDDILQSINAAASPDYCTITFYCPYPEVYSKVLNSASNNNNSYTFTLTDESGTVMDLNGQNLNMTLLFYKTNPIYEKADNFMKFLALKLKD